MTISIVVGGYVRGPRALPIAPEMLRGQITILRRRLTAASKWVDWTMKTVRS